MSSNEYSGSTPRRNVDFFSPEYQAVLDTPLPHTTASGHSLTNSAFGRLLEHGLPDVRSAYVLGEVRMGKEIKGLGPERLSRVTEALAALFVEFDGILPPANPNASQAATFCPSLAQVTWRALPRAVTAPYKRDISRPGINTTVQDILTDPLNVAIVPVENAFKMPDPDVLENRRLELYRAAQEFELDFNGPLASYALSQPI